MLQAKVFHSIACCVTHLYVLFYGNTRLCNQYLQLSQTTFYSNEINQPF